MAYVPPKYPTAIPTAGDLPDRADDVDWLYAARYNELKKELRAALIELGTDPSGGSATVKARLETLALKANVLELDNVTPFTPDADHEPATKKYVDDAIPPVFTGRGDPAAHDWTHATLTADAAWHDLDLSAIVPAGTKAVLLRVVINDDAIGAEIQFRKNGNTNVINRATLITQVANIWRGADLIVVCDTERKIEYLAFAVGWVGIYITVAGWWI